MKIIYKVEKLSEKNKKAFNKVNITTKREAKTGNKLNHNCDVDIEESIGKKLSLRFNLIWSQKMDNG